MSEVFSDSADTLTEGGRKTLSSIDYPRMSDGVSADSMDTLTDEVGGLRHLWIISECPKYPRILCIL